LPVAVHGIVFAPADETQESIAEFANWEDIVFVPTAVAYQAPAPRE